MIIYHVVDEMIEIFHENRTNHIGIGDEKGRQVSFEYTEIFPVFIIHCRVIFGPVLFK